VNGLSAIDSRMLSFVRDTIAQGGTHATELNTKFPFRNRFHHCVRVASLAAEIADLEGADADIAVVSGVFHDCGKAAGRDHADVGAEICRRYLIENQLHLRKIDCIIECVRFHSGSTYFGGCAYPKDLAVLRDADRLDEIGVMGITWTLLAVGALEPKSYSDALSRLTSHHAVEDGTLVNQMHTVTGKAMMLERINRERRFIREFTEELRIGQLDPDKMAI